MNVYEVLLAGYLESHSSIIFLPITMGARSIQNSKSRVTTCMNPPAQVAMVMQRLNSRQKAVAKLRIQQVFLDIEFPPEKPDIS